MAPDVRQEEKPPVRKETAGQEFVRKIRPAGCALFLGLFVLTTALCLTVGRDPIKGYEPPHDTAYYAENPAALAEELEENVFPALGDEMTAEVTTTGVTVYLQEETFYKDRAAILRYFDEELITFEEAE